MKSAILSVGTSRWSNFKEQFNDDFMLSLQWAAEDMANHWDEEVIPEEELASLQADVEDIINKVVDSDLDDELKHVLFDGLESVRNALLSYQMSGSEDIRQSLDRNFALPFRYSDEFARASGSDEGKQIVSVFFGFLKKVNTAISTVLKVKQISGPAIDRMLESGG